MWQWVEHKIEWGAYWLLLFMGLAWGWILAAHALSGEPVLYTYYPTVATETVPLAVVAGVLLAAAMTSFLRKMVTGAESGSFTLEMLAPKVFFLCAAAILFWLWRGAHKNASYVPCHPCRIERMGVVRGTVGLPERKVTGARTCRPW